MKYVLIIGMALLLVGCESDAERKAKWIKFCTDGEFSARQCEVLYSLKESSDEAKSSADFAGAMSGVAMGVAAGSGGRR